MSDDPSVLREVADALRHNAQVMRKFGKFDMVTRPQAADELADVLDAHADKLEKQP